MQYLRRALLLWLNFIIIGLGILSVQPAHAFQASSTQYFFPKAQDSLSRSTQSPPIDQKNIVRFPASVWMPATPNQDHFGFSHSHVLLKISGKPSQIPTILAIDNRYLSFVRVYTSNDSSHRDKTKGKDKEVEKLEKPLMQLKPSFSLGFKSAKNFRIPSETKTIYIEAKSNSALIIPVNFMASEQAEIQTTSATWSLGIFFGLAFFALLICGFYSCILRQKALGLICLFILSLVLYVVSKSNLHLITTLPLHYFSQAYIQLGLLTLVAICALYIQLHSNEHIVSEVPNEKIHTLFHASLLLIIGPVIGYFAIDNDWFRITAFKILHLPSLILAFIITSIASSVSHKRYPEQGYLLLAWLFMGSSLILEGSEFLGIQHKSLVNIASLPELSGLFLSFTVIFLTFWVLNHSALVQKERIEAIQILFEGLANKNKDLEINHARSSDLAQEIYRDIERPLLTIKDIIQSDSNQHFIQASLEDQLQPLHENLQKLTLLSQDLNHTIHAQHVPFHLYQMLERIPLAFQQRAAAHHVAIHLEIDQQLPEEARGDQSLLYKAMLLIIEHRLQELHHGSIRVYVSRDNDARSPQVHVKVRIEDSGTPYDKAAIDQFWSHSPTLGSQDFQLILAKDMIFAMGGEFKISHEPGIGNCFTARVILEKVSQQHTTSHSETDQDPNSMNTSRSLAIHTPYRGQHALIMTSRSDHHKLKNLLQQLGFYIHQANSPDEASSILVVEFIDVFFTDIPREMDILQYKENARQINPNPKLSVIFLGESTDVDALKHAISETLQVLIEMELVPLELALIASTQTG